MTVIGRWYRAYRVNSDGTLHRSATAARKHYLIRRVDLYAVAGGLLLVGAIDKGRARLTADGEREFVKET